MIPAPGTNNKPIEINKLPIKAALVVAFLFLDIYLCFTEWRIYDALNIKKLQQTTAILFLLLKDRLDINLQQVKDGFVLH